MYPRERVSGQQVKGSRAGSVAHIIPKEKVKTLGAYESTKAIEKTQDPNTEWVFSKGKR